jgi:hypothetical protein
MPDQELTAANPRPPVATPTARAERQAGKIGLRRYRVWIAAVSGWQPRKCLDVPPTAVAIEPAEEGTMSARRAAAYVRAFNRVHLGPHPKIWAIAVPVTIRYEGEPEPGERMKDEG